LLNPAKEKAKEKLRANIKAAEASRAASSTLKDNNDDDEGASNSSGAHATSSRRPKVDKKPKPNFGGGKIGTK
jgi:hypothetical protein